MDTKDIPKDGPSDWRRELSERRNALLGKLGEEASELSARCFRSMIQGLDSIDPDTKRTNLSELQDEIADVCAQLKLIEEFIDVDRHYIIERVIKKYKYKLPWILALSDERKTE